MEAVKIKIPPKLRRTAQQVGNKYKNLFIHRKGAGRKCDALSAPEKRRPSMRVGCEMSSALLEPDFNVMIGAKWAAREQRQLTSRRGDEAKLIAIRKRLYYIQQRRTELDIHQSHLGS